MEEKSNEALSLMRRFIRDTRVAKERREFLEHQFELEKNKPVPLLSMSQLLRVLKAKARLLEEIEKRKAKED